MFILAQPKGVVMFVKPEVYNSLAMYPETPWFMGSSVKVANRRWQDIQNGSRPGADSLVTLFGVLVVAAIFSQAAGQFDVWWQQQLFIAPLYAVMAAIIYALYRVAYFDRLDRHRRKYCADQSNYSYRRLFHNGIDELCTYKGQDFQLNPMVCKHIDEYFRVTYKDDVAIKKNSGISEPHENQIDRMAAEVEAKCRQILQPAR